MEKTQSLIDKKTDELIELMQLHYVILRQMQAEYLMNKKQGDILKNERQ